MLGFWIQKEKALPNLKFEWQEYTLTHGLDNVDCGCHHGHYAVAWEPLGLGDQNGHSILWITHREKCFWLCQHF